MKQNTNSNYNFLLTGAATNVGRVRKANEDSMADFEVANMKVFIVCDGMGGHVGGKVASETAIAGIREFLLNNITLDPREAINNSMIAANETILRKAAQQPELAGMGSTCVMLVVTSDGKAYYGHVGDSRIYIVANHRITQLTKDHSFVQSLVDAGQITKAQAEHHPRKNEITNALGIASMQPPTICTAPIEPDSGNCFLLCSDGLTGMVGDEQIQRVISKHEISIQQRAEKLIELANSNGGVDNTNVELVEFALGTQQINGSSKKPTNRKRMLWYVLPILIALVLGGLAWYFFAAKKENAAKTTTPQQFITLKDSVEYKSDNWISLGITIKTAEIDSSFKQFLTIKAIDNNSRSISLEWTEKEFFGNNIAIFCTFDSVIYHIIIPVKYPKKKISDINAIFDNSVSKPQSAKPEYIEIKSEPPIKLEFQGKKSITFTDFKEMKTIKLKNGEKITSSRAEIETIGTVKNNTITIKWTQNDTLPQEVAFTAEGENGITYVITLHIEKSEQKPEKKPVDKPNDSL